MKLSDGTKPLGTRSVPVLPHVLSAPDSSQFSSSGSDGCPMDLAGATLGSHRGPADTHVASLCRRGPNSPTCPSCSLNRSITKLKSEIIHKKGEF